MNVNDLHTIADASPETYRVVADLIEQSITEEHLVYRECELDELWRILQLQRAARLPGIARQLETVEAVHDLIAEGATKVAIHDAAQRLRALAN